MIRLQKTGASVLETLSLTLTNPEGNELPRGPRSFLSVKKPAALRTEAHQPSGVCLEADPPAAGAFCSLCQHLDQRPIERP